MTVFRFGIAALGFGVLIFIVSSAMPLLPQRIGRLAGGEEAIVDVSPLQIDLGQIPISSTPLETSLWVSNRGFRTLRIEKIETGCGCLGGFISGKSSAEHNERIKVVLQVKRDVAETKATGIRIRTNDKERPEVYVGMKWHAVGDVWCSRSNVDFGEVREDEVAVRTFELHARKVCDVSIVDVVLPEHVQVSFREEQAEKEERQDAKRSLQIGENGLFGELKLNAQSVAGIKRVNGQAAGEAVFVAEVGADRQRKEIRIPLTWAPKVEIQASPDRIVLSNAQPGVKQRVRVKISSENALRVTAAYLDAVNSDANVTTTANDDSSVEIAADFDAPSSSGPFQRKLIVVCDRPKAYRLVVPISGWVDGQ